MIYSAKVSEDNWVLSQDSCGYDPKLVIHLQNHRFDDLFSDCFWQSKPTVYMQFLNTVGKGVFFIKICHFCFIFTVRCTLMQSAVLRSHVVCLSVCPSVCDVGEL